MAKNKTNKIKLFLAVFMAFGLLSLMVPLQKTFALRSVVPPSNAVLDQDQITTSSMRLTWRDKKGAVPLELCKLKPLFD